MTRIGQVVVCIVIAVGVFFAMRWIAATEPTAQRVGAVKETAMLVEVTAVERGTFTPEIVVVGLVEPERDVMLRPKVSGTVTERGTNLVPGGLVADDETLLVLDPTDFETTKRAKQGELEQAEARRDGARADVLRIGAELAQARAQRQQADAELEQAQAEYEVERGRQLIARRDVEALGGKLEDKQRRLALREPQLALAQAKVTAARTRITAADASIGAVEARIKAADAAVEGAIAEVAVAQAALDQATTDAKRATIKAPFAAQVLSRSADKGSEVTPSGAVARLIGIDEHWVIARVPVSRLRWIRFPKGEALGSTVYIHHETAWGSGRRRIGHVVRLIGELDRTTRLARVVISVKDPLARTPDPEQPDRPPLILGSLVEARIQAEPLERVVRIDRGHLRRGDTVWVMKDGKLDIRSVDVEFQDPAHAFIRLGLESGEKIVTSNLATVARDAPLRTAGAGASGSTGPDKP